MTASADIVESLRAETEDLELGAVRRWKSRHPDAPVIGYLPGYAPRELVYAAGGLAVGLWGAGPGLEIVQGDAWYQSYICHLPRGLVELAHGGLYADLDGLVFPSTCDVIRNLSGLWSLSFPAQWSCYLDPPQTPDAAIGADFLRSELVRLASRILGRAPDPGYAERLREAIRLTGRQLALLGRLRELRRADPPRVPIDHYVHLMRSALRLHPADQIPRLERYLEAIGREDAPPDRDHARVVLVGAFCEQPPVGLLRTIEQAGCDIVDEDLLLGLRWIEPPPSGEGDPWDSLVDAYLHRDRAAPFTYQEGLDRGADLVRRVREARAAGVVFAAPSFCDPALLERPYLQEALRAAGVPSLCLDYSEHSYQPLSIREMVGTFGDSIRLWGDATEAGS